MNSQKKIERTYNETWLKQLTAENPICPECENTIIHKGIVRKCTSCDLTVKGNPKYVAYDIKEKVYRTQEEINIIRGLCPDCASNSNDHKLYKDTDEVVCLKCGLVLEGTEFGIDYPFGRRYQWDIYDLNTGQLRATFRIGEIP